ncbi:MAG: glycosyltransferase family 39 protein [Anaerolineales bacterium]|uniref:Glycosyltransferase family 39 protein n=1 Tax=Candidatus Desulfolinea nitratireducens TaxID=2841698 RepID=A0A8J6NQA1_9CHLR|nr:glycosyltransferase family 39 protein [Candidatus Desulfolinea nitratireducens]MBL6959618.1 glycosyltransferase family 39 protein [Anaerolineales bacterium]
MPPKGMLKYWFFFFLLASLEGGYALFTLLRIPADPTNSFFLGLSISRLSMAGILLSMVFISAWLGVLAWRKPLWRETYLDPGKYPKTFDTLTCLSALSALLVSVGLFLLRFYDPTRFLPLFERAKPLAITIIVLGLQLSIWLLFLRNGFDSKFFKDRKINRAAGIFFGILLAIFAFIAITRIGLTPDAAYWAEPGVALQGWQFGLALLGGFFTSLLSLKIDPHLKKTDLIFAILLWGIAVVIWQSVPMDVLKNSFYGPFAYPLGQSLPYSDAGFYDYLAQGLLLGKGFITSIPPRPLYIVLLAGLHALFGLDYSLIFLGQTLILALFPVVLYFLGNTLHSRSAGVTVALFTIFREWTNLLISSQTRVSNSKMTLTDIPTAFVLSLAALFVIRWLQKRNRQPLSPLIAGGIFGLLLILRTQSMLILPLIVLLALLIFWPRWKEWLVVSLIFLFGVTLSVSPWLTRNTHITGKITFDDPSQLGLLSSQYKFTDNLNSTDFDLANESLSNSILSFALQNPGFVAEFISTHFLATEINGLLALPLIEPFYGFQEPINIYWTNWDGHLSFYNQLLLIFYLAIIALGLGAVWCRFTWIGLTPLIFNLGYALSNGVARFSGWRYDFPVDWVAYFYFGVGFVELLTLLASSFSEDSEKIYSSPPEKVPHQNIKGSSLILFSFLFLLIGSSPLIFENAIPPHFESFSEEALLSKISPFAAEIEVFAAQDGARILIGRLLYPRFYRDGAGLASAHPWPAYAIRDFSRMGFVLIDQQNTQVVFPIKKMPVEFPNAEDVIVLGCQKDDYLEARLIYLMDNQEILLNEKIFVTCTE